MAPSRSHRPRRRRRSGRRRRRGLVVLAVAFLLVSCLAVVAANDALTVAREMRALRTELSDVRAAVGAGELRQAAEQARAVERRLRMVSIRTDRLLWRTTEEVPLGGRSLLVLRRAAEVAVAATETGADALDRIQPVWDADTGLIEDGQVRLAAIEALTDAVDGVSTQALDRARAALAETPSAWLPAELRAARHETLALADDLAGRLDSIGEVGHVAAGLLGRDERRRYFLAMQNPAELRGTGGLIGFYSVLTVDRGRFRLDQPQVYGVLDAAPDEPDRSFRPVRAHPDFVRRYQHVNAAGFLGNANVDPDLPTTAHVLLELAERRTGTSFDGVIAVDPIGLAELLRHVGPVDLPDGLTPPGTDLPDPVPARAIPRVTMVELYDVFGGAAEERKDYLRGFATATFDRFLGGGWRPAPVLRSMARAAAERHLQIASSDPAEQELLVELGLGGAMGPPHEADHDLLAVTANNAAANKMDAHLAHRISAEVSLHLQGAPSRDIELEVGVANPLSTTGHDPFIIGSAPATGERAPGLVGPPGLSRTWFTVWTPARTRPVDDDVLPSSGTIHGEYAFDRYLEVPARSEGTFRTRFTGPAVVLEDGPDRIYRLRLWRQAKAMPDRWSLRVIPPGGWQAASVEVHGGGDGAGTGPDGDPGPRFGARVADGVVIAEGDATEDVTLEIRLSRGLAARLTSWAR